MAYQYADIIIDISHEKVDRPFQYRIPTQLAEEITAGTCVTVPFGKGNSLRTGYVVGMGNTAEYDPSRIKEIAGIAPGSMSVQSQLIRLAWWMRERYGATMNQTLKTVLPVKEKIKPREKKTLHCLLNQEELEAAILAAQKRHYKARVRLLEAFRDNLDIPMEFARRELGLTLAAIRPMEERGQLSVKVSREERGLNHAKLPRPAGQTVRLNEEQQAAVDRVCEDYETGKRETYLIHGVTGSGKTEVYMELMARVLRDGKQVILLIPEISLTYQTVMRFYRRFGDQIAILNSRLSAGERYDQWERAARSEVSVMIGPRSALFAPFSNLGLILIDEEHEGAYKSETMPRYHAREVAAERARLSGASLVLGSATPSLESYLRAQNGEYVLLPLHHRAVAGSILPRVQIADMRAEMQVGNKSVFSRTLDTMLTERLARGEQAMLFMNRRGYSNFVSCRSCGKAVTCPHCDVSLTLHGKNRLVCHYCGYTIPLMKQCPSCGSPYIAGFGAGTQKMEEFTKIRFPDARILRMDADTTAKKGGHEAILEAFANREADILIGTQMIVKGHDFPGVTLVGILAADLSLNTPDYRSAERTFQLLTQAAGRAGRAGKPGDVVIQTYRPEHYAVQAAAAQNYELFYSHEINYRRLLHYPPVCQMAAVYFACGDEAVLDECAEMAARRLRESAECIGPVPAPVYKVNDIYRKILYIKCEKCAILDQIRGQIETLAAADTKWQAVQIQYDIS